ncbi:MAG: hypothetical protein QOG68_697 [Solirubrobacteraceae bacterium]|nr:hypothetical protein [Solirubrobacteraceae bacterium]
MAVQNAATKRQQAVTDQDVNELTQLLGETLHALKQGSAPPPNLKAALERSSLAPRHVPALLTVARGDALSVSELARRIGLGLSTTSTIVGELSRAGLVERSEDEADRRRTIVRLHDDYQKEMKAWALQTLAPLRNTLERLSPQARAHFLEGLRVLHDESTPDGP